MWYSQRARTPPEIGIDRVAPIDLPSENCPASPVRPLLFTGFLLLLLLGGCASSRVPDERPRTLTEVNEQLDERWARIRRTDGRLLKGLENVQVGPDSTTFYHRFDQVHRTLPTASVRTVQIRGDTGSGTGFLTGAAPGIAVSFMGGALAVTHSGGESIGSGIAAALGLAMAAGGAVVGLVGGTIGAIVGGNPEEDDWVTIYEGPITIYQR